MDAFNESLVASATHLTINEYITEATAKFYPSVDISFSNDLVQLCRRKEICIPHEMLVKYGVVTTEGKSGNIARMLDQYGLVEGQDYHCSTLSNGTRGGIPKKSYTLHPNAFQKCLMRSKNEQKYADFYIHLLEMITQYELYNQAIRQAGLIRSLHTRAEQAEKLAATKDVVIKEKETTITKLNVDMDELRALLLASHAKLDEQNAKQDEQNVKQDALMDKLDATHDELIDTRTDLHTTARKLGVTLEERVVPTGERKDDELFTVLRIKKDCFRFIRGKRYYVNGQVKVYKKDGAIHVITLNKAPNAVNIANRLEKALGNKVRRMGTSNQYVSLLTDKVMQATVIDVNDEKYEVILD